MRLDQEALLWRCAEAHYGSLLEAMVKRAIESFRRRPGVNPLTRIHESDVGASAFAVFVTDVSFDRNYSVAKSFRLDGKHALITVGGGGIGAGIGLALSEAGANVTLVGRTESALRDVASKLQSKGYEPSIAVCDITDSASIRSVIDGMPRLDIMVNNAGTNFPQPIQDVTDENLDLMLNLNVRALFVASQAAINKMLESGHGAESCVINITSQFDEGGPRRSEQGLSPPYVACSTFGIDCPFEPDVSRPGCLHSPMDVCIIDKWLIDITEPALAYS